MCLAHVSQVKHCTLIHFKESVNSNLHKSKMAANFRSPQVQCMIHLRQNWQQFEHAVVEVVEKLLANTDHMACTVGYGD